MAVLAQPKGQEGVQMSQMGGVPQSIQYLASLDQVIVRQKKEMLEILTGFEVCNRYEICNNMNQQLFFVQEESSFMERCCCPMNRGFQLHITDNNTQRCCCPMNRGFQLHITDNNTQEVMRISREFKLCTGCCWCGDGCCNMELVVEAPVGRVIGKIRITNSKWKAHIEILDANNTHLFTIWGPCCICQSCCCPEDVNFPITDPSLQHNIGRIGKQWRGCCVEAFTDADQYCLQFPMDMQVETKCLLIGSLFLVDYWMFEQSNNN